MNYNLLVVDDDDDVRDIIAEYLSMAGHTILTASSGNKAIEMLKLHKIDFIISDVRMPDGDGIDLVKNLQLIPGAPPIILCSGQTDINSEEAKRLGAIDLFDKPINFATLLNIISVKLGSR